MCTIGNTDTLVKIISVRWIMKKEELFKTVVEAGIVPRKTFSMGSAKSKRFYMECRKIKN